jgi:hypothetical protein
MNRKRSVAFVSIADIQTSQAVKSFLMEQHTLTNINNWLNTNIYSYLETSGGQCPNPYLNVVHFFKTSVN